MDFTGWMSVMLLGGLVSVSVRVLLVAGVAAALAWLLRRQGAEVRHAVWMVVLAGMLLMPVLAYVLPPLRILPSLTSIGQPSAASVPRTPIESRTVMTVTASGATTVQRSPFSPVPRFPVWPKVLMLAYCLIAAVASLRVVMAARRAWRLVDGAEPVHDEAVRELLRVICIRQGTGYPPPLVVQSGLAVVPFTAGWQAPAIVLPIQWRDWDEFKLRAVLAHEMAHIRRGDWSIALAAAANRAVFWFHPLSWWLERRLAILAEEACDAWGIEDSGDARRYASVVLDFAAVMANTSSRLSWEVTAMARCSRVGRRIDRILEGSMNWSKPMTKTARALLLALAVPVLYAAAAAAMGQEPTVATPSVFIPTQHWSMIVPGGDMTANEAAAMEARVARNSHDVDARQLLVGYYFRRASAQQFADQLFWLVENAPASEAHESYPLAQGRNGGLLLDDAAKERLSQLWLAQTAAHATEPAVFLHAARFFELTDPEQALELRLRARAVAPENLSGIDELVMTYMMAVTLPQNQPQLAEEARVRYHRIQTTIENSNDAELLGRCAERIARPKFKATFDAPAGFWDHVEQSTRTVNSLARMLLERARSLAPADERWPKALARLDAGESLMPRPSQAEQPLTGAAPEYPALAKLGHVEGIVQLNVTIRPDGRVDKVTSASGHPLLMKSAVAAVKQWRFAPRLNEQEVSTVVSFKLPNDQVTGVIVAPAEAQPGADGSSGGSMPSRIKVGGNVQRSLLVESPDPVYPPLALQARISGSVRFSIVIDKEGKVTTITLVAGHPLLVQSAVEAVRQYTYRPTLLNGEPVEVATTVDVPFTLSR